MLEFYLATFTGASKLLPNHFMSRVVKHVTYGTYRGQMALDNGFHGFVRVYLSQDEEHLRAIIEQCYA